MKTFDAGKFAATETYTAEDKAKFANQFVTFVESDMDRRKFTKAFYTRLHMMFGFIAHYDIHGFYAVYFTDPQTVLDFLKSIVHGPHYGDWADVERELASWVLSTGTLEEWAEKAAQYVEDKELAEYARLKNKYG